MILVSHAWLNRMTSYFVFESPLVADEKEINEHLRKHGDGVKDIAFSVQDCQSLFEEAVKRGAEVLQEPKEEKDEDGKVRKGILIYLSITIV